MQSTDSSANGSELQSSGIELVLMNKERPLSFYHNSTASLATRQPYGEDKDFLGSHKLPRWLVVF